jgi:hypothetical protein
VCTTTESRHVVIDLMGIAGMPLAILDAMPVPLFLVDRDVRLLWGNASARKNIATFRSCVDPKRSGEVLRCLNHTADSQGCGHSPACQKCVVRNAVRAAFEGRTVSQSKTTMQLRHEDGTKDFHLLVTAAPVTHGGADVVMLVLQDVSELIQLRSLIPICASCKSIRDDDQYWHSVEQHLRERLDVEFTHGICPSCRERLYPGMGAQSSTG